MEKNYPDYKYVKVKSTPIMIDRVIKENMIGVAPLVLVKDEFEKGHLAKLNIDVELPKLKIYMSCKKGNKNYNNKAVIEFFKEHFGNYEKSLNND